MVKRADDNPFYVSTTGRCDGRSTRDIEVGIRVDTVARASFAKGSAQTLIMRAMG
ncbi:MAG TPA: hypothetical protein VKA75_18240 [Reyranella sp.]|nr:hypothetical protein [Reyranella sp.]